MIRNFSGFVICESRWEIQSASLRCSSCVQHQHLLFLDICARIKDYSTIERVTGADWDDRYTLHTCVLRPNTHTHAHEYILRVRNVFMLSDKTHIHKPAMTDIAKETNENERGKNRNVNDAIPIDIHTRSRCHKKSLLTF